jgi:hypothetical protein
MHEQRSHVSDDETAVVKPADAVELDTSAARVYVGQPATDSLVPALEPAKQPECAVMMSHSSVKSSHGLLRHPEQSPVAATAVDAAKQVGGAAESAADGRRASVIMMDTAHTPEVGEQALLCICRGNHS